MGGRRSKWRARSWMYGSEGVVKREIDRQRKVALTSAAEGPRDHYVCQACGRRWQCREVLVWRCPFCKARMPTTAPQRALPLPVTVVEDLPPPTPVERLFVASEGASTTKGAGMKKGRTRMVPGVGSLSGLALTVTQARALLGVSNSVIRRLIKEGRFKGVVEGNGTARHYRTIPVGEVLALQAKVAAGEASLEVPRRAKAAKATGGGRGKYVRASALVLERLSGIESKLERLLVAANAINQRDGGN